MLQRGLAEPGEMISPGDVLRWALERNLSITIILVVAGAALLLTVVILHGRRDTSAEAADDPFEFLFKDSGPN